MGVNTKSFDSASDMITFSRASGAYGLTKVSYGPELIDTNTANWARGIFSVDGTLQYSGNTFTATVGAGDTASSPRWVLPISTVIGNSYAFAATIGGNAGSFSVSPNSSGTSAFAFLTATGSLVFTAIGTTTYLTIANNGAAGSTVEVTTGTVKEVTYSSSAADATLKLTYHPNDVPRIEYNTDGTAKGLLVEEIRTNLVTYSEDFSVSGTTREDAGEFQGMSRKLFTKPTTSAAAYTHNFTASAGDYTLTLVMEQGTNSYTAFGLFAGGWLGLATIDWDSMTISAGAGTLQSSSVEILGTGPSGNQVARLTATINVPSAGTVQFYNYLFNSSTTDENLTVYFYHQQVEAGAFSTSYIKTEGATATRSADVASIPVADFGYNQSEGTVVVEASTVSTAQTNHTDLRIKDGSAFPLVSSGSRVGGSSEGTYSLYSPLTTILVNVSSVLTEGSTYKSAYRLADNDVALSVNGSTVATDTSVSFTSLTAEAIEIGDGYGYLNGHIKSIKYYPRRLTNAQLQELTT